MEDTVIEREIKFRLPDGGDPASVRAVLESEGFRLEPAGTVAHDDRYLDTEEWALYRAGIALRLRAVDRKLRLEAKTLRSEEGPALTRLEWSQNARKEPPPWNSLEPGPVAALLRPLQGLRVLERLGVRAHVRNDRECFRWLRGDALLGSLTVDHVSVPPATFREIEVELENGTDEALVQVRRAVEKRLGLESGVETKLAAALEALGARLPERDERRHSLDHADRLLDVAHKTFGCHLGRLLWNEPGTRLGVDPEYLHDMRVACRRLRTALEVLAGGFPEALRRDLEGELQWLGRALGRVRDLDVALEQVATMLSGATATERPALQVFARSLEVQRARRRIRLVERLDSESYLALTIRARAWAAGVPSAADAPKGVTPAYAVVHSIVGGWTQAMEEAFVRAEATMAEEDLHALRIAAKKARYSIEYFAELEGPGAARRAKRIAGLQDLLGDHRDALSLLRRMEKYAETVPRKDRELVVAAGSMLGHLERTARIQRDDLRVAWEKASSD